MPGQRGVSAAADAQPRTTSSSRLATHAQASQRTRHVWSGSPIQRCALTGDESRLASGAGSKRGIAAGDATGSGRMSAQSRLAGETRLTGNACLADETRLTCHSGLPRQARLTR